MNRGHRERNRDGDRERAEHRPHSSGEKQNIALNIYFSLMLLIKYVIIK